MQVFGLTGVAGAGREAVASLLEELGLPVIDCDRIYRELLVPPSPLLEELFEAFGLEILTESGELDRKALGRRVFTPGNEAELEKLNAITHPYIRREARARCQALVAEAETMDDAPEALVVSGAMLLEAGMGWDCLMVFSVIAPKDKRLKRIMEKTGLPEECARAMIRAQKSDSYFRKHTHGGIVYTEDPESLRYGVPDLYRIMCRFGG